MQNKVVLSVCMCVCVKCLCVASMKLLLLLLLLFNVVVVVVVVVVVSDVAKSKIKNYQLPLSAFSQASGGSAARCARVPNDASWVPPPASGTRRRHEANECTGKSTPELFDTSTNCNNNRNNKNVICS